MSLIYRCRFPQAQQLQWIRRNSKWGRLGWTTTAAMIMSITIDWNMTLASTGTARLLALHYTLDEYHKPGFLYIPNNIYSKKFLSSRLIYLQSITLQQGISHRPWITGTYISFVYRRINFKRWSARSLNLFPSRVHLIASAGTVLEICRRHIWSMHHIPVTLTHFIHTFISEWFTIPYPLRICICYICVRLGTGLAHWIYAHEAGRHLSNVSCCFPQERGTE